VSDEKRAKGEIPPGEPGSLEGLEPWELGGSYVPSDDWMDGMIDPREPEPTEATEAELDEVERRIREDPGSPDHPRRRDEDPAA